MEEKKESAARPSPWKCVRTVEHNGQSFQDILNESTQKAKEKELSGSVEEFIRETTMGWNERAP